MPLDHPWRLSTIRSVLSQTQQTHSGTSPLHSRHHNFRLHKLLEPHVHIHIPLVLPSLTGSNGARPSGISISKRLVLFVRTGTNTSYTSSISSSLDATKSIDDTAATVPRNPLQSRSALHESSCFTAFGQHIHPVAVDSRLTPLEVSGCSPCKDTYQQPPHAAEKSEHSVLLPVRPSPVPSKNDQTFGYYQHLAVPHSPH